MTENVHGQPIRGRALYTYFPAFNHGGPRVNPKVIVGHDTEGDTAEGAARWFSQHIPIDHGGPGSAQLVVDDRLVFRSLADGTVPYGAPPLNTNGLHIEQEGHASWTKAQWLCHPRQLARVSWRIARWSTRYGIPLRLLRTADLRKVSPENAHGVTWHIFVSDAYGESTHHDPGENYPFELVSVTLPTMWQVGHNAKDVLAKIALVKP